MDDILQFSYSQQLGTFSFTFMQDGRFMVTYKVQTAEGRPCRVRRPCNGADGTRDAHGMTGHVRAGRPEWRVARAVSRHTSALGHLHCRGDASPAQGGGRRRHTRGSSGRTHGAAGRYGARAHADGSVHPCRSASHRGRQPTSVSARNGGATNAAHLASNAAQCGRARGGCGRHHTGDSRCRAGAVRLHARAVRAATAVGRGRPRCCDSRALTRPCCKIARRPRTRVSRRSSRMAC